LKANFSASNFPGAAFGTLPPGFSGPLAGPDGTELLTFDPGIREKTTAAMSAADGAVHGFLLREAGHLKNRLSQEA
jgi:hypothetical protein